jgi:defect-in-organelle-trafficking protein DotB
MNLDELPSIIHGTDPGEIVTFPSEIDMNRSLDDAFIESLVEFCKSHKLAAATLIAGRKILAISGENVVAISNRQVMEFETDDIFETSNARERIAALGGTGRFEIDDLVVTQDNVEIPFKRVYSVENGLARIFYVRLDGVTTLAETYAEERLADDPFAGRHNGSFFEYDNYLNEKKFDDMLRWATEHKASDISLQPNIPVMAQIGSDIVPITRIPINTDEIDRIIRHVSSQSGPAEVLGGAALDPAHEVFIKKKGRIRFRVNVTGGRSYGGSSAQISIRSLPTIPVDIKLLDLEPELIHAATNPKMGLVLFCGPTGAGKSTTMSSLVRYKVELPNGNIKVLEFSQPIEQVYDGINMPSSFVFQTTVGQELRDPDGGSDFAYAVKNAMRRKPHWIIIGESRDTDTMQNTLAASQSGHLVLSTMHSTSVANTIRRAVNMFPANVRQQMAIDIMEQLRLICVQQLIPKIGGGRIAIREFMVFGEEVREKFLREETKKWPSLTRRLFAEKSVIGQSMNEAALRALMAGQITEEEYEKAAATGIDV